MAKNYFISLGRRTKNDEGRNKKGLQQGVETIIKERRLIRFIHFHLHLVNFLAYRFTLSFFFKIYSTPIRLRP